MILGSTTIGVQESVQVSVQVNADVSCVIWDVIMDVILRFLERCIWMLYAKRSRMIRNGSKRKCAYRMS